MRRTSVQNTLIDDFKPGPPPPMGPDGAPQLAPVRDLPPDPPRLCAAGPCRHYHQFAVQIDAQNPMDERQPDGTIVRHGRVFHVQTHHYCYPDVGIETELGAVVLACNRWVPVAKLFRSKGRVKRAYEAELSAFVTRLKLGEHGASDAADIAALEPAFEPVPFTAIIRDAAGEPVALHFYETTEPDETLGDVAEAVLVTALGVEKSTHLRYVHSGVYYDLADEDGPLTNLTATIEQLGLAGPTKIQITIRPTPKENA